MTEMVAYSIAIPEAFINQTSDYRNVYNRNCFLEICNKTKLKKFLNYSLKNL